MCADEEFMRYLGDRRPMSRTEAWRHMAMMVGHWALRGYGLWAVEERARPGIVIGRIGCQYPAGWPDFEVGWAIARPMWGRGYATEGARAAMRYAFETVGRDVVVSCIAPGNTASVRVAERLGESLRGDGEIMGHPVLLYGIDRASWQARS